MSFGRVAQVNGSWIGSDCLVTLRCFTRAAFERTACSQFRQSSSECGLLNTLAGFTKGATSLFQD